MNKNLVGFLRLIEEKDITLVGDILFDGEKHRIHIDGDKHGSLNGEYRFNDKYGYFKCWKRGVYIPYSALNTVSFSGNDLNAYPRQQKIRKRLALIKRREAIKHAAKIANKIPDRSTPVSANRYLDIKQVKAHDLKIYKNRLVIGLQDIDGNLQTAQFISPDGSKRFLKNGQLKGNFHLIGNQFKDELIIAEGYATAASIYECTGITCVVVATANNLSPVALNFRKRLPNIKIIIAADNDYRPHSVNIGIAAAKKAARAVNGYYCVPTLNNDPNTKCDFNDLSIAESKQAVCNQMKELRL